MTRNSLPNYDQDAVSLATGLRCEDPSLAQQQFKDEADINVLVQRFGLVGTMPQNPQLPQYGDFSEIVDFQTALNAVHRARDQFAALPSGIRDRFNQSPQALLSFLSNPANRDEAVRLGLVNAPPSPSGASGAPQATSPTPSPQ